MKPVPVAMRIASTHPKTRNALFAESHTQIAKSSNRPNRATGARHKAEMTGEVLGPTVEVRRNRREMLRG
jgi:hypothetical protein